LARRTPDHRPPGFAAGQGVALGAPNAGLAGSLAACLILGTVAAGWLLQSRRLGNRVRQEMLATHSVAVLPFLDLDTAQPDEVFTKSILGSLQTHLPGHGPARDQSCN
jgi:hypothetical protein